MENESELYMRYGRYDNIYKNRIFQLRNPGDVLKDEIIFELVRQFGNKNSIMKVLDIGCGMGHTSILLSTISSILVGVDTSIEGIKIAKNVSKSDVLVADCTRLPFKDNYFNIVIMKDVLVYINDDSQAIEEINRILQMDGLLILYVPHPLCHSISFGSIINKLFRYSTDNDVGFIRRYDIIELNNILINFKIIESFYFAHFLFGIVTIFGIMFDKTKKSKIKENEKSYDIDLLNLLLKILKVIKLMGKIEFSILRNVKGGGLFAVAKNNKDVVENGKRIRY